MMLVVATSRYERPLAEVDALRAAHWAWLEERYAAGRVLVSGRQVPPRGGVIVARGDDVEAVEAMLADDPFVRGGVARYELTAFDPAQPPLCSAGAAAFLAEAAR